MSVTLEKIEQEVGTLSFAEKRELFDLLRLELASDDEPETISDKLKAELELRLEDIRRNPEAGISWEQVKREILGGKCV